MTDYRAELRASDDWDAYLAAHSGLPGPRGNLELAAAASTDADEPTIRRWASSADEYQAVVGTMGLARLGDDAGLQTRANDERWRVREGVAMGLQRFAAADRQRLLAVTGAWSAGTDLERRAAVATLAEPPLLEDAAVASAALDLLDRVTADIARAPDRRAAGFRTLRKTLGYAWSVVVTACPDEGRRRFERWLDDPDRDIAWIVRENLRKARLARMDAAWTASCRARVGL